jgi:hypothetical protein
VRVLSVVETALVAVVPVVPTLDPTVVTALPACGLTVLTAPAGALRPVTCWPTSVPTFETV